MNSTPRRTFLHLLACIAVARGLALGLVWAMSDRHRRALPYVQAVLDTERIDAQIRVLSNWIRRVKGRRRYTHREWQLIYELAQRWSLTGAQVARIFLVSNATACRQMKRWRDAGGVIPEPPKPIAPCVRISDPWRTFVQLMVAEGFVFDLTISRFLALQGVGVSASSVGRIRREPSLLPTAESEPTSPSDGSSMKPPSGEPRDLLANIQAHALLDASTGPRLPRNIRALADAFVEGLALGNLWLRDDAGTDDGLDTFIREAEHHRSCRSEVRDFILAHARRLRALTRHHFDPAERADVLAIKAAYRLSNKKTAPAFDLDEGTLSDWNRDVDRADPRLVAPLASIEEALAAVQPFLPRVPPRRRAEVGQILATLGAKVPVRKRRTKAAKPARPRKAQPADSEPEAEPENTICPEHPNHYWSSDLSVIRIARECYLAAFIDLYSRDILAWELFAAQPNGDQIAALFQQAVDRHGSPRHFITDQGRQFVGDAVQNLVVSLEIGHRTGAIGEHGSIAIHERLWRTAKEHLDLDTVRPEVTGHLRARIAVVIDYYRTKRPHSALEDTTPATAYTTGVRTRATKPKRAPIAWRGQPAEPVPLKIRHAFPNERKLPYLERSA